MYCQMHVTAFVTYALNLALCESKSSREHVMESLNLIYMVQVCTHNDDGQHGSHKQPDGVCSFAR